LLGELPTVLALHWTEKSLEISKRLPTRLGAEKARPDPLDYFLDLTRPGDRIRLGRTCYRHEKTESFTVLGYCA
jgi:hypothetical protein